MKHVLFKTAATVAVSLGGFGIARADVTFQSIGVTSYAETYASDPSGELSDYESKESSTNVYPLAPLSSQADAAVSSSSFESGSTGSGSATASLTSVYSGLFNVTGEVTAASPNGYPYYAGASTGGYFSYNFYADAPETLRISYSFDGSNPPYSSTDNVGEIEIYDYVNQKYDYYDLPYGYGVLTYKLNSGYNYFFIDDFGSDDDAYTSYEGGSQTGSQNDNFSFSISAAPEPSAWALMIAGVSIAGLALRRRRPGATLAAG